MKENRITLKSITLVTFFTLCCLGVQYFSVQVGSPYGTQAIRFGGVVIILAAILSGSWAAAISGGLGMLIYRIINNNESHNLVVFLVCGLIGWLIGFVYKKANKHESLSDLLTYIFGLLLIGIGVVYTYIMITTGGSKAFKNPSITLEFHWALIALPFFIGIASLGVSLFGKKIPENLTFIKNFVLVCAVYAVSQYVLTFSFTILDELRNNGFKTSLAVAYSYCSFEFVIALFVSAGLIILAPIAKLLKDRHDNK